jgi:hypothetical protein
MANRRPKKSSSNLQAGSAKSRARSKAVRLIFEQKDGKIKLVSTQRVNMIVPPPQALTSASGRRGSSFELRDTQDRPVYRRVIENPVQDLEVVVDDPRRPLQRIKEDRGRGAFFLIVPDITGARKVALNLEPRRTFTGTGGKRGKSTDEAAAPTSLEFDFSNVDKKER